MKTKFKILPVIILGFIILLGSIYSFHYANAASGFIDNINTGWSYISDEMSEDADSTYPYDGTLSSDGTVTSVSLDILYGTTRDLLYYHGEVPERETTTKDGKYVDEFEGVYFRDGTNLKTGDEVNPNKSSSKEYWGFNQDDTSILPLDSDKNATRNDMENVNSDEVISLRLYSLSSTKKPDLDILYTICKGLAWFSTSFLIKSTIIAKNIDMDTILDLLNLDELANLLTKNFIFDSETNKLSAFTGFCIIMYIFSLASYAIRYAKGDDKEKGLLNMILSALLALLIIGMCLSGRISTLGSSIADVASELIYVTAGSLSEDGDGKAFTTMIDDDKNTNKIVQLQEMSMINKSFIKLQICTQFGVNDIQDLSFKSFGDADGTEAKDKLLGISDASLKDDFNNNLGYYFWYANSSAKKKTSLNTKYPKTNTAIAERKLGSMMTYLQTMYNKARTDNDTKIQNHIKGITESLANPKGGKGCLVMLLYVATLVILAICLLRYAISVMISKLELFAALVGFTVAGPLMLTNNKTLQKTSHNIVGMLLVSFINITVYSIIFDIILYIIASMISTDPAQLLVTLVMVILLMKFNPIIAEKIKQLLDNAERSISPTLAQSKRAAKNWTRNKYNKLITAYDNADRVIGHDANGDPIREKRGGDALSKVLHHGMNYAFNEGDNQESFRKINRDMNEMRNRNTKDAANKTRSVAETKTNETRALIDSEATQNKNNINAIKDKLTKEVISKVDGKDLYSEDKLSSLEKDLYNKMNSSMQEAENIANSDTFKKLVEEKMQIDEYNKNLAEGEAKKKFEKASQLASLNMKIQAHKHSAINAQSELNQEIDNRLIREAFKNCGYDYDSAIGENDNDKISYVSKLDAQNKYKDELRADLQTQIEVASEEANSLKTGKIGATKVEVNTKAVASQASAEMMLSDLDNDVILQDRSVYNNEAQNIARTISQNYTNTAVNDISKAAFNEAKSHLTVGKNRSTNIEKAKQNTRNVVNNAKQDFAEAVQNDIAVRRGKMQEKDYVGAATTLSVSDQISELVRQRESKKSPINNSRNTNYTKNNTQSRVSNTNETSNR